MYVTTRVEFDWSTGRVLSRTGYRYYGPVSLLKGASAAQEDLATQQAQFYKTMSANYATQFANNAAILSSLQTSFQPILDAGINQFGFNPAETAALRTQASEGTAQNYAAASKSLGQSLAANSGGTGKFSPVAAGGETYIPSGQAGQIESDLAVKAAAQESAAQLGITTTGYEQGRSNYLTAASALGGVAGQYNPLGYASATTGSGTSAFNSATEVQKMNNAASPWGAIGGILGGVAGSFLGPIGASFGSKIGGAIGGAGSGGGSQDTAGF